MVGRRFPSLPSATGFGEVSARVVGHAICSSPSSDSAASRSSHGTWATWNVTRHTGREANRLGTTLGGW